MSIFTNFFKKKITCPRCLGKGYVDENDIKRLKKELFWAPGKCAYCNGKRKVPSEMLIVVSEDEAYLTTSLSKEERKVLLENNPISKIIAKDHTRNLELFVEEVYELYSEDKMNEKQIAEYIDSGNLDFIVDGDTIDYVKKVIEIKKSGL